MSHKAKAILDDGESFVVATLEFWNHMILLYEEQSGDNQDDWAKAAEFIREQVITNLYYEADKVEDWE